MSGSVQTLVRKKRENPQHNSSKIITLKVTISTRDVQIRNRARRGYFAIVIFIYEIMRKSII